MICTFIFLYCQILVSKLLAGLNLAPHGLFGFQRRLFNKTTYHLSLNRANLTAYLRRTLYVSVVCPLDVTQSISVSTLSNFTMLSVSFRVEGLFIPVSKWRRHMFAKSKDGTIRALNVTDLQSHPFIILPGNFAWLFIYHYLTLNSREVA